MQTRERLEAVQQNLAAMKKSAGARLLPASVVETITSTERLLADVVHELEAQRKALEELTGFTHRLADLVAQAQLPKRAGVRHA